MLEHKVKTYAIVRRLETVKEFSEDMNFTAIKGDIESLSAIKDLFHETEYDVFYHFAWIGTSGKILADADTQIKNIEYGCKVLAFAHELNCKKFIFAGTINELELLPFYKAETFKPRSASIYGISKLTCDFMFKTLSSNMDMCYNTAIIGSCFGPGDMSWRIHNSFIKGMLEGISPKLVNGDVWHDWIYIDDAADMFVAIGQISIDMKNYYIGHRKLRKLKDILCEVRDILCEGLELEFGEITDNFQIDYSLVDLDAVYKDTGYECKTDFQMQL